MSAPAVTVRAEAGAVEAGQRMIESGIRHLVVVDEVGAMVGLLTDRMLLGVGALPGPFESRDALDLLARDVCEPVMVTATEGEPLLVAMRRLLGASQDAIVVVRGTVPVGVVTEHDCVEAAIPSIAATLTVDHEGSWPVHAVARTVLARDALAKMLEHRIRHLVVTDEREHVIGVLSIRDLTDGRGLGDVTCADLVRAHPVVSVPPGTGMRKVASLMHEHRVGCVPVLHAHDRHAIAIVTRRDVIEAAVAGLEDAELFPS